MQITFQPQSGIVAAAEMGRRRAAATVDPSDDSVAGVAEHRRLLSTGDRDDATLSWRDWRNER